MAKTTGISEYVCDRCGKTEYIPDGSQSLRWYTVHRYDQNDVLTEWLLCRSCYADYQDLQSAADVKFAAFRKNANTEA